MRGCRASDGEARQGIVWYSGYDQVGSEMNDGGHSRMRGRRGEGMGMESLCTPIYVYYVFTPLSFPFTSSLSLSSPISLFESSSTWCGLISRLEQFNVAVHSHLIPIQLLLLILILPPPPPLLLLLPPLLLLSPSLLPAVPLPGNLSPILPQMTRFSHLPSCGRALPTSDLEGVVISKIRFGGRAIAYERKGFQV